MHGTWDGDGVMVLS